MEKGYERRREEERKHDRDGSEKDELILDLENFMTLDAVGSVDGMQVRVFYVKFD